MRNALPEGKHSFRSPVYRERGADIGRRSSRRSSIAADSEARESGLLRKPAAPARMQLSTHPLFIRAGYDDYGKPWLPSPELVQYVEPVHVRHVQIKQYAGRLGLFRVPRGTSRRRRTPPA